MSSLLILLFLASLAGLGIGQVRPNWVLPWEKNRTRRRATLTYGIFAIVCFLFTNLTAPVPPPIYPEEVKVETAQESN